LQRELLKGQQRDKYIRSTLLQN